MEEKSSENRDVPQLCGSLDVADAVVSIDAAGCQRNIAVGIILGGGDNVLTLKGN